MPTDSKRLPYPENTRPREIFKVAKEIKLLSNDERRKDGRLPDEIRPIFIRVGVVSSAKGSAYLEMNRTKVLCSVFGPREMTRKQDFSLNGKINCTFKYAPFSCPVRRQYQQDSEEKEFSTILKEALDPVICLYKYPKSIIDINVLVIENDGSSLSAAITSAGAALADGGIDLYDIVVGSSFKQSGSLSLLDPTLSEELFVTGVSEDVDSGSITLGWMPSLQQIATVFHHGNFQADNLSNGMKTLVEMCGQTSAVVQQCLLKSAKQNKDNSNDTT